MFFIFPSGTHSITCRLNLFHKFAKCPKAQIFQRKSISCEKKITSFERIISKNNDNTTQHVFFREVNSIIFDRVIVADYDSVLEFFPARQDLEIIGHLSVKNGLYCNI
jgi:hypothetical protein